MLKTFLIFASNRAMPPAMAGFARISKKYLIKAMSYPSFVISKKPALTKTPSRAKKQSYKVHPLVTPSFKPRFKLFDFFPQPKPRLIYPPKTRARGPRFSPWRRKSTKPHFSPLPQRWEPPTLSEAELQRRELSNQVLSSELFAQGMRWFQQNRSSFSSFVLLDKLRKEEKRVSSSREFLAMEKLPSSLSRDSLSVIHFVGWNKLLAWRQRQPLLPKRSLLKQKRTSFILDYKMLRRLLLRRRRSSRALHLRSFYRRLPFFWRRSFLRSVSPRRFSSKLHRLKIKSLFDTLQRPFPSTLLRLYWKLRLRPRAFHISLPLEVLRRWKSRNRHRPLLSIKYGEIPQYAKNKFKPNSYRQKPRAKALHHSRPLLVKRSYSYLFVLPSLPLWLLQFFYFSFAHQETLFISVWLNFFLLAFARGPRSTLYGLLNLYPSVFFQRATSLSLSYNSSFLYFSQIYDSRRFFSNARVSLNDFDRRRLPRRSLWVVRKKPWRRYPQKMFEGYKRFAANSFFRKHLFLSFDYSYTVRFNALPLTILSSLKVYQNRPNL